MKPILSAYAWDIPLANSYVLSFGTIQQYATVYVAVTGESDVGTFWRNGRLVDCPTVRSVSSRPCGARPALVRKWTIFHSPTLFLKTGQSQISRRYALRCWRPMAYLSQRRSISETAVPKVNTSSRTSGATRNCARPCAARSTAAPGSGVLRSPGRELDVVTVPPDARTPGVR